ncbi:MAG: LysM peptidoglycan-binding domain-containing protein [Chloroflexi bacterium]|nr:LysM peptidoglycan-binding domain-containing protein [Chloroflexota bacterium]
MHRPRLIAPILALATSLVVLPVLVSVVLAADPTVTVKRGDTLTGIARRHGVDVATLVALNQLADPNRIFAGQELRIGIDLASAPPGSPAAAPAPEAAVHVVARGENLTRIARHYGVTVTAIVQANGIANPSLIFGGQRLTIPGAPAAAAPPAPAAPQAAPMSPWMAARVAERDAVRQVIVEEANRYGVPVPFALAVAWQESGWQQGVVSHAGAVGVMQLMPATAVWVGDAMLGEPVAINDMRHNVRGGVRLLAHYLARYGGDRDHVLAAYYQGQSAVDRHGIYPVSRPYIVSIKRLELMFGV